MSRLYDGSRMQGASVMLLETRIMHLAHDLDKTVGTLLGTEAYLGVASGRAELLREALTEWDRRGQAESETIQWARSVLGGALSMQAFAPDPAMEADGAEHDSANAVFGLIRTRRSVRRWSPQEVEDDLLERLLESATWAPSACNRQSVRYLVVRNPDTKAFVATLREGFIARADTLIIVFVDTSGYFPEEADVVPYLDAAMAAENALLAAHASGLGAVFVKCTPRDLSSVDSSTGASNLGLFRERFRVPAAYSPVGIIALGWPAATPRAPARRDLTTLVSREAFSGESGARLTSAGTTGLKRTAKRVFVRSAVELGRRMGLRVFIATD